MTRDEPVWTLPHERRLQAEDIDTVRLPVALRGYRFAETDILLDRLAGELRDRDAEIAHLRGEPLITTATDETGGREIGRDEIGRDETGRDETGRDEAGRDEADRDEADRDGAGYGSTAYDRPDHQSHRPDDDEPPAESVTDDQR